MTIPDLDPTMRNRALLAGGAIAVGSVFVWSEPGSVPFRVAITALLAGGVIALAARPQVLNKVKSLEVGLGGFRAELFDHRPPTDAEVDPDLETTPAPEGDLIDRWLQTRWQIERKLAFVVKHTIPDHLLVIDPSAATDGSAHPFGNLGSLHYDGYLEPGDAEVATRLLALSPADLATSGAEDVVAQAEGLVRVFRARVFQRLLDRLIDDRGWEVVHARGLRRTVQIPDGSEVRLVPIFGSRTGKLVKRQVGRLTKLSGRSIVVLPCRQDGEALSDPPPAKPWIVRFDQLDDAIDQLVDA